MILLPQVYLYIYCTCILKEKWHLENLHCFKKTILCQKLWLHWLCSLMRKSVTKKNNRRKPAWKELPIVYWNTFHFHFYCYFKTWFICSECWMQFCIEPEGICTTLCIFAPRLIGQKFGTISTLYVQIRILKRTTFLRFHQGLFDLLSLCLYSLVRAKKP